METAKKKRRGHAKKQAPQPEFLKAKKSISYFQKYLLEFIIKLSQAFPEMIDETNMKSIMETLRPIKDDTLAGYKGINDLKKSVVFKYMAGYLNHVYPAIDALKERKLDLFDPEARIGYGISKKPLVNLEIDFVEIWKSKNITDQLKTVILTYLGLMATISVETVDLFKVSEQNKHAITQRKTVRQYRRKEMKSIIYNLLGENGKNASIDVVIDDILGEFEKSKEHLQAGNADPQKLTQMIQNLYGKLTDKYEDGKLDEKELVNSSKNLFQNVMNNEDLNLKKNLDSAINMMKAEDNDENILKEMMQQAGMPEGMDFSNIAEQLQSGDNPFDTLMKQMQQTESKTSDNK